MPTLPSILPGKEKAYASSILPGKEKAYASSILPGKEKAYASSILPGKEKSTPLVSPPERRCPPHPAPSPGGIRLRFHHETEEPVSPGDTAPPVAHQILRKYSDRKLPCRFLYKAPARSVPDKA